MKKKLLAAIFVVGFICSVQTVFGKDVVKMRYAFSASPSHVNYKPLLRACERIKKGTNGNYQITVYPGRQLGADRDTIDLIRTGVVDMGGPSAALFDRFTTSLNALQMPFLIKDYAMLKMVYLSEYTEVLVSSVLEPMNIHFLAVTESGMRGFANNVKEIITPADMKGLTFRVADNELHTKMLKVLGAIAVPISWGEIYTSMKTGVIEGAEINATSASSEKLMEVVKYYTVTGHFFWPSLLVINGDKWRSFPPDVQKIFNESFDKYTSEIVDIAKRRDLNSREEMKKRGIKISYPNTKPFLNVIQPVYDEYMRKDPRIARFVKDIQKMK